MAQDIENCSSCKFGVEKVGYLVCKVGPPAVVVDQKGIQSVWPPVPKDEWCGVWEPKKK